MLVSYSMMSAIPMDVCYKMISSNGEEDPFYGTNRDVMHIYETQIERVVNRRGYFLVFENASKSYNNSSRAANVTIRLSDGTSAYSDAVGYDLRTRVVTLD